MTTEHTPTAQLDKLVKLATAIAAHDEFTGATSNNPALFQAYNLLNQWRRDAVAALKA